MKANASEDPEKNMTDFTAEVSSHIAVAKLMTKDRHQQDYLSPSSLQDVPREIFDTHRLRAGCDLQQLVAEEDPHKVGQADWCPANCANLPGTLLRGLLSLLTEPNPSAHDLSETLTLTGKPASASQSK